MNRIEVIYCWEDWVSDLPLSITIIYEALQTDQGRNSLLIDAQKRCDSTMLSLIHLTMGKNVTIETVRNFYSIRGIYLVGIAEFNK